MSHFQTERPYGGYRCSCGDDLDTTTAVQLHRIVAALEKLATEPGNEPATEQVKPARVRKVAGK